MVGNFLYSYVEWKHMKPKLAKLTQKNINKKIFGMELISGIFPQMGKPEQ